MRYDVSCLCRIGGEAATKRNYHENTFITQYYSRIPIALKLRAELLILSLSNIIQRLACRALNVDLSESGLVNGQSEAAEFALGYIAGKTPSFFSCPLCARLMTEAGNPLLNNTMVIDRY